MNKEQRQEGGTGKPDNELPRSVLARCFLRSLLLQASWSARGMQSLGFLYAIEPALRHLYPKEETRKQAAKRHLQPFNTHPYMAEAVLGGAIHHEVSVSTGNRSPARVSEFKQALAGPLAALGDTFFWGSLRPFAAALGVALVPFIGVAALIALLVTYNAVHLGVRAHLFYSGLRMGDGVLEAVGSLRLSARSRRLKLASAMLVGIASVALVATHIGVLGYSIPIGTAILVIVGALLVSPIVSLRRPYSLLLAVAGIGVLLGVAGVVGI